MVVQKHNSIKKLGNVLISRIEEYFIVISLILLSNGFLSLVFMKDESLGGKLYELTHLIIFSFLIFLVLININKVIKTTWEIPGILLFLLVPLISIFWSINGSLSFSKTIGLILSSLFAIYIASTRSLNQSLVILYKSLLICLISSYIFALFFPQYGVGSGIFEGNWQGIYNQKNSLGRIMVLNSLIAFLFLLENDKKRIFNFIVFILSIVLIILSDSKTSLVVLIILMSIFPLLKVFSFRSYLNLFVATIISLSLFLMAVISISKLDFLFSLLGKDSSLTGRLPLWEISILMIEKRLLTGYGFDVFWESPHSPVSQVFRFVGWVPPHAHNGFIDLFLDLGLLGFLIFIFIYTKSIKNSLLYRKREGKNIISLFPLLYLIYFLLININESSLVKPYSIFWILFVLNVCYLNKSVKEKQYIGHSTLKGEKI